MKIMVSCSDDYRRVAEVDQKPINKPVLATVWNAKTGQFIKGFAWPTEGLNFKFTTN